MNSQSYMDQGNLSDQENNNTINLNGYEEEDMEEILEEQPNELIPKQGKLIGEEFLKKYFITVSSHRHD